MLKKVSSEARERAFGEIGERVARCWCGQSCLKLCGDPNATDTQQNLHEKDRDSPPIY